MALQLVPGPWPRPGAVVFFFQAITTARGKHMTSLNVTCGEYRSERRLLALKGILEQEKNMDPRRRAEIEAEVAELERELGMD